MTGIEPADISASELLHERRYRAHFRRSYQQMHMVVHQHIGVQFAASGEQRVVEQVQVSMTICLIEKAGQAIVAALHDMLRDT